MKPYDVQTIRSDFPMLKKTMSSYPLIYLDSAATTHKPLSVIDTMSEFYRSQYATVHRAVYELAQDATCRYDAVREKIRKYISADHIEEIVFTRGTTEAINLVASSFGKAFIQPGDVIAICETEHHSNIIPWQMMCQDRGAILRILPCLSSSEVDLDMTRQIIEEGVKLVAIAHMANTTGTIHPIKEIIDLAHRNGAKVLIDGAQAASHLTVNVKDLDADFYVFSGHKMYGPTGIGILYGKLSILEMLPPYHGGGDMVQSVSFEKSTYQPPPLKFEAGTPLIAEVIGLGAAVDYIEEIGRETVRHWEDMLFAYAMLSLQKVKGLTVVGNAQSRGPIISFTLEGVHPLDLGTMLGLKGVAIRTGHMCAQPTLKKYGLSSMSRISFGLYNTQEDIDLFIDKLLSVLSILRR